MIRFNILSGRKAGSLWSASSHSVRIGRSSASDLLLEDDGVWEEHCEIALDNSGDFVLASKSGGIVSVNGKSAFNAALRNGDIIDIGASRLQFWLDEVQQTDLRWREWMIWGFVAALSLSQIAVIYLLLD